MAEDDAQTHDDEPDEERLYHQRNDSFYRGYFKQEAVSRPLLEWKVPPAVISAYGGLGDLELAPNSYIDKDLRPFASDLLWKVKGNNAAEGPGGWFYNLWEHQKNPDAFMPLRTLRYLTGAWMDWVKSADRERGEKLPPAVALVLYQGTQEWTQPLNFTAMVDFSPGAKEDFGDLTPSFEIIPVPLDKIPEEDLPQSKLCFLGLTLMQAVARGEIFEWLDDKEAILTEVLKETGVGDSFLMLLTYISVSITVDQSPKLTEKLADLGRKSEKKMKTAYDLFIEEGLEKGREEIQHAVIWRMTDKGLSPAEIADLTDFSEAEVQRVLSENPQKTK